MRDKASSSRVAKTTQERIERLDANRDRMARSTKRFDLKLSVFHYSKDYVYRNHKDDVVIGLLNKVSLNCRVLKFAKKSPGMCCSNGKMVLPPVIEPPETLLSYISGDTPISKYYL